MAVTQAYSQNLQRLFTGEGFPDMSPDSFVLMVDRRNIVDSTVIQLIRSDEENFKKPLKVGSTGGPPLSGQSGVSVTQKCLERKQLSGSNQGLASGK